MKKILVIVLVVFFVNCKSNSNNENDFRSKLNVINQDELTKKITPYIFEDFSITKNNVGIFSKDMTVSDIYNLIPEKKIIKTKGHGEFKDDIYDDYEIYDHRGTKILVITPKEYNNLESKINRILILDGRFKTTEKVGLNSTFAELNENYKTDSITTDKNHVVIHVTNINAWFTIKKSNLKEDWWREKKIDKSKIPLDAKFDQLILWWN